MGDTPLQVRGTRKTRPNPFKCSLKRGQGPISLFLFLDRFDVTKMDVTDAPTKEQDDQRPKGAGPAPMRDPEGRGQGDYLIHGAIPGAAEATKKRASFSLLGHPISSFTPCCTRPRREDMSRGEKEAKVKQIQAN